MLSEAKRFYQQARSKLISLRAVEVSELREYIDKRTDEEEAKDLEFQTMSGLVAETTMLLEEAAKL